MNMNKIRSCFRKGFRRSINVSQK
uniref:Uncharacterized protein n=1 Tax=Rhizophora mucronata TaxID=61149 RepID=A0A2P2R5D0_RHIMU